MIATRRTKSFLAAFAVSLALSCGFATTQAAGQLFQVWGCTDGFSSNASTASGYWFSVFGGADNHCPDGLEFPSGNMLDELYAEFNWVWNQTPGDSALKRVTFTMKGGSTAGGLVYELAVDQSAPAFHTLPTRAPGAADLVVSVNIPAGIKTLVIRARCPVATCSGTSRLRVNDIKFLLEDTTPPVGTMRTAPMDFNFDADSETTGQVPWFQSNSLPIGASFSDEGGGVGEASLKLDGDGGTIWAASPECFVPWENFSEAPPAFIYESPQVCGSSGLAPPPLLDISQVGEGRHKLILTAKDAFGLAMTPKVGWFGVDDTRPAAPKDFTLGTAEINEHGWTQSPIFSVYLGPGPDQGSNASPIVDQTAMISRDDENADDVEPRTFLPYGSPIGFQTEGHFRVEGWFTDGAGNPGHSTPIAVGFDRTKPPAPELDTNDWISREELIDGFEQTWDHLIAPDNVESDICGFNVAFDKEPIRSLPAVEKIKGNVNSAPVPANLAEGYNFSHVAAVSCAGLVSDTEHTPLPVDATAPEVAILGLPVGEWSRDPLNLTLQPSDALSGVKSFDWSLGDASPSTATDDVELDLGDGEHLLTTWARDNAGNESDPNATVIRVDSTAPVSWLGPTGDRPNEFSAHVKDPASGLDSAALQFRRVDAGATVGEQVWRQAGPAYLPTGSARADHTFKRLLDDSALADGTYELRVAAVDRAGNVGYGSTLPADGNVRVSLPLRARPAIALAVSDLVRRCSSTQNRGCATTKKCRRGSRCTFKWVSTKKGAGLDRIINWGDRTALTGSILRPDGEPLSGVKVSIYSTAKGGTPELIGSTTSGSDGSFEKQIDDGPTRSFVVKTGATDELAAAETTATLAVRAGVSFTASDLTPRPGQRVRLGGRLGSGGFGVPAGGKKITIEFYSDGEWRPTFSSQTDGAGRFKRTWRIPRSATPGKVFLRAHAESLPTETSWPFEAGKSATVVVNIGR